MKHGAYSGYTHGCRCDDCREAARVYHGKRRADRRELRAANDVYNLPTIQFVDAGWMDHAACKGMTDVFFPATGSGNPATTYVEQARAVCANCPVQGPCADYANQIDARHGVWAGHTTGELKAVS
jgi:WhiB family redox-sensing transcriptional regulator